MGERWIAQRALSREFLHWNVPVGGVAVACLVGVVVCDVHDRAGACRVRCR